MLFLLPNKVFAADIIINEFSSVTSDDDWVELYNTSSSQSEDLSGYTLIDGSTSGNPVTFSCILAPQGFVIASWSNRLNNGGDIVRLKNVDTFIDCVAYGDGAGQKCDDKSVVDIASIGSGEYGARSVDGTGNWIKTTTATKDGPNNGSSKSAGAVCSTPTSTPTPSPTPTSTPIPTPIKTPTPTKSPSPTKTPTPTKSPSPASNVANATPKASTLAPSASPTKTSLNEDVLGEASESASMSALNNPSAPKNPERKEIVLSSRENNIAKILIVLGFVFILACGILFSWPHIKKKLKKDE